MSLIGLTVVAVLFGVGTYLIQQRLLTRIVIGLGLISHGVNLLIILSGRRGLAPVVEAGVGPEGISDPLPQAMVLTAIVIAFGVTAFLLALALRSFILTGSDAVEDDLEDRRIAGMAPEPATEPEGEVAP
ncbi:MAG: sodium:proton antiporter [Acidimicrobiia bacterium]|nr:sodium:proton antiporter [Acidimicrobiia bacterium]